MMASIRTRHWSPAIRRLRFSTAIILLGASTFLAACSTHAGGELRAETLLLRNGQRLNGKILRRPTEEQPHYIVQLGSGTHVRLTDRDVGRIDEPSAAERKYLQLLPSMPDTVDGHYKMAQWCHEQRLQDQKRLHLEYVIHKEPNHTEARHALGYTRHRGKWGRPSDHMEAHGYERSGGQVRIPLQIELEKRKRERELAEKRWRRDIQIWRKSLDGKRNAEASRAKITQIDDPLAAPGLRELLADEPSESVRQLYIDVLAKLPGATAEMALVDTALHDGSAELRIRCLDFLHKKDSTLALESFVRQLGSADNSMVRRAGVGLGRLGNPHAVRPLIEALVTTHEYLLKPQANIRPSFGGTSDGQAGFNGLSVGGGPKKVSKDLQNRSVLDALTSLTGKNFGFSTDRWKQWYIQQHSLPAGINLRRGP